MRNRTDKILHLFLTLVTVLSISLCSGISVLADSPQTAVSISSEGSSASLPFSVENMFPGDAETKTYEIDVSHKASVTLAFSAALREADENLASALKFKISDPSTGQTFFDGSINDLKDPITKELNGKNTSDKVYYEITGYLSTSAGNEYMDRTLIADFKWEIAEDDISNLDKPPKTFDGSLIVIALTLLCLSAFAIVVVLFKKKKEDKNISDK